ncbi:hypothetical protein BC835DRAFT_191045 [Cytidiella melzeri]|nr:hypothetical protein BC835DRAFT_191045 [Cytidiella melzeri]
MCSRVQKYLRVNQALAIHQDAPRCPDSCRRRRSNHDSRKAGDVRKTVSVFQGPPLIELLRDIATVTTSRVLQCKASSRLCSSSLCQVHARTAITTRVLVVISPGRGVRHARSRSPERLCFAMLYMTQTLLLPIVPIACLEMERVPMRNLRICCTMLHIPSIFSFPVTFVLMAPM